MLDVVVLEMVMMVRQMIHNWNCVTKKVNSNADVVVVYVPSLACNAADEMTTLPWP